MLKIGLIGAGLMGMTHLDAYSKQTGAKVIAVADLDPDRRSGKIVAEGNIQGQAQGGFDFSKVQQYAEGMDLIANPEVDVVDICLVTPLHLRYAIAALEAGKHLLVEKPLARTSADARAIADCAARSGVIAMPAMCMRFWPGWVWLKEVIASQRFGRVLSANFRRLAAHPAGRFYTNAAACGGAILDLHIHDTDFVRHCFGTPNAVYSRGYTGASGGVDHVVTSYEYENGPMVVAEGGWIAQPDLPFTMQYMVNFERAAATFDLSSKEPLRLYEQGKPGTTIELPASMGYEHEITYFLDCVRESRQPSTVTLGDALEAIRIIECEVESVQSGHPVPVPALGSQLTMGNSEG